MSLLDTASLIVTPNGYKEGKLYSVIPSDGSGDLSVTRATTATRVNSAGLVELVPYNLLQYSENYSDTSWIKSNVSVTSNSTTAPDGTTTADTITDTASGGLLLQVSAGTNASAVVTQSFYFKKSNTNWVYIGISRSGSTTYGEVVKFFNLNTGAIGSTLTYGAGVFVDANIQDAGNGWYRCSLTASVPNALGYAPYFGNANADGAPFVSDIGDATFVWGAQLVEGSTAKDYQKTETRLNIPRLDYSNGTCPSLLVEPQRTNICRDSNNLSGGSWLNQTTNSTLTRIQSGGPDGNAFDRLVVGGALNSDQGRFVQFTTNVGSVAVYSVYLKGSGNAFIGMYNGASATPTTIALTNEWTRYEVIATGGSGTYIDWALFVLGQSTCDIAFHQVEFASYPTSYIPTTSASVTRNADVISKTGISSLIGQTEGTLFWDVDFEVVANNDAIFIKENATFDTFVFMQKESSGIIACGYYGSGALQARIESSPVTVGRYKIAFAYKNNDFVMYLNGTQVGTDTSGTVSGLMDYFDLHWTESGCNNAYAAALWKTRLTNTQLAQLTTI